ncbi:MULTISPECIES: SDR family NAD(P)-dependent oxidoreductase [unclassified Streptomyces]|uniref:SDR family NAD(P)-dependent oxidoreductase n=1 Tax=unclassified Streptomyces TaxID=2593676 RepID=UPI000BACC742|nr:MULTISPECIES: SDR family oxidoreductase [unclassified Streptomyces]ASY34026.1 short-chain dehydrogenase [Streptomyces sp. CLI2509]MYX18499.1 SDR family oxidoreductase [Streptomyces sp. SID8380]
MVNVLIIGATQGTGRELAAAYLRDGANVVVTGREAKRAETVAAELTAEVVETAATVAGHQPAVANDGGPPRLGVVTGLALDLSRPETVAAALTPVDQVDRLVLVGMVRDRNTLAGFDITTARQLAVTKVVGYTAVIAALAERLAPNAAVLLFGGGAKDYPYPGSTTLTAVNAAVTGMVRTLSIELAPVRVNAIHPGPIGDSPFWQGRAELADTLAQFRSETLTGELGRMADIVDACRFLLENRLANGIDLSVDGGHP